MCVALGLSLQPSILLGLNWTVPWGEGLTEVQVVKAKDLELRRTRPSGPGTDLICAGQENPAQLVITPVHEESAPCALMLASAAR